MFDDLFDILRRVAEQRPDWLQTVDAEASDAPAMWGKQAIRVVFPDGRILWLQEVKQ